MSDFVNTVDLIGDAALTDSIIDRSITEICDNICTSIRSYAFYNCTQLTAVVFSKVATGFGEYAFANCTQLTTADFPSATTLYSGNKLFDQCSSLTSLILRNTTYVCRYPSSGCLSGTAILAGTGYIYVPRALLNDTDSTKDYRRATGWTTFASQFRALEDYTVDGTTTGELDPTKI